MNPFKGIFSSGKFPFNSDESKINRKKNLLSFKIMKKKKKNCVKLLLFISGKKFFPFLREENLISKQSFSWKMYGKQREMGLGMYLE